MRCWLKMMEGAKTKRCKQDTTPQIIAPSSGKVEVVELPSWIRTSEFVEQFEIDFPGQPIELPPERNFPFPTKIDEGNIELLLDNVRFFGVRDSSDAMKQIFIFLIQVPVDDVFVEGLKSSFDELNVIWNNVLFAREHLLDIDFCSKAARKNLLMCLTYAHENGCPWNEATCLAAAYGGHIDCLKYAHENGCPWNGDTCSDAARGGHLDCLIYAHENGCPWNEETCSYAAGLGRLVCLTYAHENGCPWNKKTCSEAADGGHLDCLTYAHENGCPWNEVTCCFAAIEGYLDCLKYAHENGCPWNGDTCSDAAHGGHLDCLKYAHEN
jgi:hypothetical protein